ncbi:DNA polymerase III subunit delta' [Caulobacter sp. S45]|jgi:DNA polymerase-3 subunit delta'|uniref:DNA polymerase III subunit delta' n=1 Tax=Caulobacter sp. S45 TaxID=1641861 RepID=UPI00131D28DC|nr:DNA polymerase III subunit delta' [Caulobacter sp. S45]
MSRSEPQAAPPHPRHSFRLDHVDAPAEAFEQSMARGRLHHAWLLTGPEGVGKASFAYRAVRRLLGAASDPSFGPLGSSPDDPVSRMIAAQSHPDLIVLERAVEGGVTRRNIPVDEARRLPEFFAKAPAIAPFRAAIIDAADDMNVNAANAVLKTLEEPSGRGVLFLISHAPGRLLPTIRSRCRRLAFSTWSETALAAFAREHLDLDADDAIRLAGMAHGAPGRLLALAASGALAVDDQAERLLGQLPDIDRALTQGLADGFRGGEGAARFALVLERLADRLHQAATSGQLPDRSAAAWSRVWARVSDLPGEVEGLNLDRADAFWTVMAELSTTARNYAAPF